MDNLTAAQRAEIERFEAGEDIGDGEAVPVVVRRPLDKVIPVRLSADQWSALTQEAHELGLRPTTLMRMWVLDRLRQVQRAPAAPARARSTIVALDEGDATGTRRQSVTEGVEAYRHGGDAAPPGEEKATPTGRPSRRRAAG